jgi:uncharacterized repeat protein (TIGR01451 family)
VFVFSLSASNPLPVTVRFATSNVTAVAGNDYQATEGLLIFPPGVTRQTVPVLIHGDTVREGTEFFRLQVRLAQNATLESSGALGVILDDEPVVVATLPFHEDWEGGLRNYWMTGGAGPFRSSLSRSNQPHQGAFHLLMDNLQDNGVSARSEMTLGVDLAGATNAVLRFWAKNGSYDPGDGPPPAPFLGGANFDGVAVSMDGLYWYEVQGLRAIPTSYTEFVVPLDERIRPFGLAFTKNFRIRFNHVSSYEFPFSGVAIDDISITADQPAVQLARLVVVAEDCAVPNQNVDPGEKVTAEFWLANTGGVPLRQLTATLLSSGNLRALSGPQDYGALAPGGPAVARPFRFEAEGLCGDPFTATLELAEAGQAFARVQIESILGQPVTNLWTVASTNSIQILSNGPAIPFPSPLWISATGRVQQVVVKLDDFSHPLPDQVDILLRAPGGQTVTLLSDTGGLWPVEHVNLVFDGAATNRLGDNDPILSGTYSPTNHGSPDAYPAPAPAPPYGTRLDAFVGSEANGFWELFVLDDTLRDGGRLGGWSLEIVVQEVRCCGTGPAGDLAVSTQASTNNVAVGSLVGFTSTLVNHGPSAATDVVLSNGLPAGTTLVAATPTSGTCVLEGGNIVCRMGTLLSNATAGVTVTLRAGKSGLLQNVVSVSSSVRETAPSNNTAQASLDVAASLLTMANAAAAEGAPSSPFVRFTVNLVPASTVTSSVQFATSDISAVGGVDYSPTNGLLTFLPGETAKSFIVPIVDDGLNETNEEFAVNFSNPLNLSLLASRVVGTITDNDLIPGISLADVAVMEGQSGVTPAQVRVQLTAASGRTVGVDFSTVNLTATAPGDYISTNGHLTFVPGETSKLVPILVRGDQLNENNETFLVNLNTALNGIISDPGGQITILNDDFLPSFAISPGTFFAENCTTNRALDPGETVELSFSFRNLASGGARATNLTATLQAGGGVLAPGPSVVLGPVNPGGLVTGRFTLTVDALCGQTVQAAFALRDQDLDLGQVSVPLAVGRTIHVLAENFDAITVPALPSGWSAARWGNVSAWRTLTALADTAPNAVTAPNPATSSTNELVSPPIGITTLDSYLTFRHTFNTESNFDGGILEISIDDAPFSEWLVAGGQFIEGAYNGSVDFFQDGWTGSSAGYRTVVARLPSAAAEHTIRLRWRFTSDSSVGAVGWTVDTVTVSDGFACCELTPPILTGIETEGTAVTLRWLSTPDRRYQVQYKSSLNATGWTDLPGEVLADGPTASRTDLTGLGDQRFYRVVLLP